MIHYKKDGEKKIYWKSVKRKHPDWSTYRAVSNKLRRRCRKYNLRKDNSLSLDINTHENKVTEETKKTKNTVHSLANILEDFIAVEKKKLNEYDLSHAPSIGNMYEGLTGAVVDRIIPTNLDLRIVTGFVIDDNGYTSGQIDRMLVQGEGEEVPYSGGQFKYHIKDVLVIFEVKKALRKSDFEDAYEHLRKISSAYSEYFERRLLHGFKPDIKHAAKLFSQITAMPEPTQYSDIHGMKKEDAIVFYTLVQDVFSPVTLIHGYGGYKTETGLRNVFINFIKSKVAESGFGAPSLPNLVSSESFSIVKLAGMPFMSPREGDGNLPLVASSCNNVAQLIVEIIWTKISAFCGVSMPWGDDLGVEALAPLITGKYRADPSSNREGWLYSVNKIDETALKNDRRDSVWQPHTVARVIKDALQYMGMTGNLDLKSASGIEFIKTSALEKTVFIKALMKTHLCAISKSEVVTIIGESIHIAEITEDEFAISNDKNRLSAWCELNSIKTSLINIINLDKL